MGRKCLHKKPFSNFLQENATAAVDALDESRSKGDCQRRWKVSTQFNQIINISPGWS